MFDNLVDHHKVHKVETAGDCYIVAGGIIQPDDDGFYDLEVGGPVGGRLAPAAPSRWVGRWACQGRTRSLPLDFISLCS